MDNFENCAMKIVNYIDERIQDNKHGEGYWVMPDGEIYTVDVGYAAEWWKCCMRDEIINMIKNIDN